MKIDLAVINFVLAFFMGVFPLFQSIPLFPGNIFKKVSIIFEVV